MANVYFITHPEVVVDKNIPITSWDLSEKGKLRMEKMLSQPWIQTIGAIFTSNETKAITLANRLGEVTGIKTIQIEDLGEMDRSSTGFLQPEEFNQVVDDYFARPDLSIRGWEKAIDTQKRIIRAVEKVLITSPQETNIAIVSHGGVGGLLLSHLLNQPISRKNDQPSQGHYFIFDSVTKQLIQGWKSIDSVS